MFFYVVIMLPIMLIYNGYNAWSSGARPRADKAILLSALIFF